MPALDSLDDIRFEIQRRWQIPPWDEKFPWWPRPAVVKILFYADGSITFDGGPFLGLKQVLATLSADPYHWVRFQVTTVHRAADPSAQHQGLDLAAALALDAFDELWIYSIQSAPGLTATELAAAQAFMDAHQGGVLITGDHADLGQAFGNLPRAGKMRQLPAPQAAPPVWNTTLRSGADAVFEFSDQSDSTPQPLDLRWYWGGPFWRRPHPVLCSPLGPINIFPDHQHEGEALAPPPTPASEWPGGVAAEVIAWGSIIDPSGDVGRSIGVLSAYDGHSATVGRIVADSTWHHHFDINLRGLPGDPTRTGFVTPGTGNWLSSATKIEHYFLNAAIWLAPPATQARMRWAAWWPILWSADLVQLDHTQIPVHILGRTAWDALGRRAPQCAVFHWVWDLVPVEVQKVFFELLNRPDPPPDPAPDLLPILTGAVTAQLMERFGVGPNATLPSKPPSEEEFTAALDGAVSRAFTEIAEQAQARAKGLLRVAELAGRQR
jgi:hypothetical protein